VEKPAPPKPEKITGEQKILPKTDPIVEETIPKEIPAPPPRENQQVSLNNPIDIGDVARPLPETAYRRDITPPAGPRDFQPEPGFRRNDFNDLLERHAIEQPISPRQKRPEGPPSEKNKPRTPQRSIDPALFSQPESAAGTSETVYDRGIEQFKPSYTFIIDEKKVRTDGSFIDQIHKILKIRRLMVIQSKGITRLENVTLLPDKEVIQIWYPRKRIMHRISFRGGWKYELQYEGPPHGNQMEEIVRGVDYVLRILSR
jgi:hypothetical protein